MTNRVLKSLAVMAVAGATAASATVPAVQNLGIRCNSGALKTCVTLSITTQNIGSQTLVLISIRNMAGSYAGDQTGGSLITRLGIVAPPGITSASNLTITTFGGATAHGSAANNWFLRTPGGIGGMIELAASVNNSSLNGGIAGCASPNVVPSAYFTTCVPGASIDFAFTTNSVWSAGQAELAWLVQDANNPVGGGVECDSRVASTGRNFCAAVTPEPVTMMLLGSGLASMGGFGLVRRRRNKDVVNG